MMGVAVVVRNAECCPEQRFCGCVVGRVVEVESIGVRGRTRRPVLGFRPTVGVIVAACAAPRDLCGPHLTGHAPPDGYAPGFVGVHPSWMFPVLSAVLSVGRARVVVGVLLVEWWRSSSLVYAGVLDVRYSTFALLSASSWLRVLAPRLMWPRDRSCPAGWLRPGCPAMRRLARTRYWWAHPYCWRLLWLSAKRSLVT